MFVCLFVDKAHAMGGGYDRDAECLRSEFLRVEIGGEEFAFPRKMVRLLDGSDVINPKDVNSKKIGGSKACQEEGKSIWKVDMVALDVYPLQCKTRKECFPTWIKLDIYSTEKIAETNIVERHPKTLEELLDDCHHGKKFRSKQHGAMCDFVFKYKDTFFLIEFFAGTYPLENIEHTKQLVLDNILKYKNNNKKD